MKKNLLEKYCENTHTLTRNSWQTHTALAKARKYVKNQNKSFSSTQKKITNRHKHLIISSKIFEKGAH